MVMHLHSKLNSASQWASELFLSFVYKVQLSKTVLYEKWYGAS